jgi:hypothetical protein
MTAAEIKETGSGNVAHSLALRVHSLDFNCTDLSLEAIFSSFSDFLSAQRLFGKNKGKMTQKKT